MRSGDRVIWNLGLGFLLLDTLKVTSAEASISSLLLAV
jgi:hypothetical protein